MKFNHIIFGTAILAIATPLSAGSLVTGYNVVVFNSFSANSSDSNVPIAIGGNATTYSYSFYQSNNSSVAGGYGTVVGGNLNMTYGTGPSPVTYVGGTATINNTSCNTGCVQTGGSSPVNFGTLQNQMLNESSYLSSLSTNGSVTSQYNSLIFNAGTTGKSLYVFDVNASQLTSGYTYLDFVGTGNATVLVNVNGSIASGSSIVNGGFQGTSGSNVLFNFYNASQITVSSFDASVLAPYATVYGNNGQFDGSLVAENFSGVTAADEFHSDDSFSGTLPSDPNLNNPSLGSIPMAAPEPDAGFLAAGGILVGLGIGLRRFRHGEKT